MKHGMFQRSVSLLLALVMILGNVPMNALATETEETTTPVCEHSYEAVTTDATCTADGVVVYTCGCGDTYSETIAATGHTWGEWAIVEEASYEAAGSQTRTCACGASETAEIPQLVHEHSFGDWSVVTEATYEAPGAQVRTCECGTSETEAIPQLVKEKAELSGEKRKIYFLNTENWEEVYIAWSFDEEDFQDVAFPGEEMEADEVLENVFVMELPVEADAVVFGDGVEVTEELKAYEAENGIETIHSFAAELDKKLDYFSAAEQVAQEEVTEWLAYEDVLEAWEAEIAAVQAQIDALPTSFASEAEVDAFWTATEDLDAAIETLTEAQQDKLDQSNYEAAMDAAASFTNPDFDNAGTWEGEESTPGARASAPSVPNNVQVGSTVTGKGTNAKPTGTIPECTHWEGPVKSTDRTCGKDEHTHDDDCYKTPNATACSHFLESTLLGHPDECTVANLNDKCTKSLCFKSHKTVNGTKYHVKFECQHQHTRSCYIQSCIKSQHTHDDISCYDFTWTLAWNQYSITWNWVDASGNSAIKTETLNHGANLTAPAEVPGSYEKDGTTYTLTGWKDLEDGATATGDATFTAVYTSKKLYVVTFNSMGGSVVSQQNVIVEEGKQSKATEPAAPNKDKAIFAGWYIDEACTNAYDFNSDVTGSFTLYAKWIADTNSNDVDDTTEQLKVSVSANATVTVNGNAVTNGTMLYDSTKPVTIVATPASGYYIDAVVNNNAALNNSWTNKDIDDSWLSTDNRNVYTGTFAPAAGTSYDVAVTATKFTWALPKDAVTVKLSGYLFGIASVSKEKILTAIYGENFTDSDMYSGTVDEGLGSITIKLEEPFQYKITLKATDKYPEMSDTIMVTASDSREYAVIETDYINGSDFNTVDDFKSAFANSIRVDGENVSLEGLTSLLNGSVSWTDNEDGTYTATVEVKESATHKKTTKVFENLTWTVKKYPVKWVVKNDAGEIVQTVKTLDVPYNTDVDAKDIPAVPNKEGYTGSWSGKTTGIKQETVIVAVYTINTYKVTWKIDGEQYGEVSNVTYGEAITAPEYTVPAGYTFSGWTIPEKMPAKDIELNATLTANTYKVNFVWQNAEGKQTTTVEQAFNTAIKIPENIPVSYKDGNVTYTIVGWDIPEGATVPVDGATYTATYTTATAWTVKFVVNDGSYVADQTIIVESENNKIVKPADPSLEGHRFAGWYTSNNSDEATEFTGWGEVPTADITLYAKWVKLVTVTFDVDGIDAQTFDINGKATKPADPDKEYAVFGGWLLNGEAYDFATPVTENITLTAKWIDDANRNGVADAEETISITVQGNGTIEVTGATELALGTVDTTNYLFDSTKPEVKITATPVVAEGVSQSYVKTVMVGDQAAELTYGENFVATVELTAKGGDVITVNFADAAFIYDEDGQMRFYVGMETPKYETLYKAVMKSPEYVEGAMTAKYLARPAGTYTFTIPVLFEVDLGTLGSIIGYPKLTIGGNEYTADLDDKWLDVGEEFKTLTEEELQHKYDAEIQGIKDKIATIDLDGLTLTNAWEKLEPALAILEEVEALAETIKNEAEYLGFHQFGEVTDKTIYDENGNVQEKLQITYRTEAMYLKDEDTLVTLVDDRITTVLTGGDLTFEYDEYTNADLLAAIKLTTADGEAVNATPYIQSDVSGKDVGEYTYNVYFDGDWNYKPCTAKFNLNVIKAPSNTDIVDVNITYGESYEGVPMITNKHGKQIDADVIEFILGLDVANLDLNENKNGIVGVNTVIQLMMPEELEAVMGLLGLEEGATISLSDLIDLLGGADSLLGDLGLSGDATAPVEEALDYLVNIFDSYDLQIMLGGERPTNVGAYLHGAVALDSNYETSYDIGYILIAPKTTEYTLEWNNPALNNSVVTLPAFRNMDLGATAAGAKDMEVSYLFLGINNETGDIYSVDIYGDIKLNVWAYPENIKDNGAYVQMAYGIEWGNEFEYAIPIIRSFVIVPDVTKLDIIVDGQPSADLYKTVFDNAPVDVTVNGQIPEGGQVKLHYYGIEANTETYDSDMAPSHTGAYAITATLVTRDANGEMTSVGLDVATVVIQPTESAVTMKELETVTYDGQGHKVSEVMEIVASSTVENLKPDTTVITASIATDGSFSENGWAAAQGTVNVDFPRWMDELIAKYAPSVKDGITLSELEAKLLNKLPTITDKLEELGATNEMVNSTRNLLTNVSSLLDEMPADAVLSFKDDYEVLAVGTYAVAAVVTDSDHVPAAKAGVMVIVPSANQVYLDWEYHDENNIWSRDLLKTVSIGAIAYNDKEFIAINTEASKKITYQFIGLDQETGLKIYDNAADLPNGVYTQIAYIELDVESQIVLSDIIVRTIVIVPNMPELQIVNKNGAAQDKLEFTFDNAPVELYVKQNGQIIENQIRYIGLQTNGVEYDSTVPPVHAGAYAAITVLKTQENVGMDVALVTIAPAKSDISVTGGTVAYNGKKQTATVKAESPNSTVTSPDYTLISGTVDISAGVQNVGLESLCGDVNIDLPNWLDNMLAKTEFNQVDADVASVATFISTYRNDLLKLIPELMLESTGMSNETVEAMIQKLNGGIDELLKVLAKLPDDVNLTFESNKGYTELGSYFYYGIVTDSDHIPAADTGLLVIEPAEITSVDVTTEHVYDGKEQTATVVVKVGDVELPEDCYTVSGNVATEAGKYTVTVVGKGNYTGKVTAEWAIEKASVTVTLNDKTKTYGEKDTDLTYTVKGLAVGDFAADLNIQATRKPGENVGEYAITATAENANYNITIIDGTLTIEKADAIVTVNNASKVYGEEDPKFTATISGLKGDDKLNVVFSRKAGQDVGEYVISATIAADDAVAKNYNITVKTGILTITQKDITTGNGYPICFQPGDANGMIKVGTTVYVDDVAYILDENCVAWAADKNRELAIGYVYKNSGNHTTDHAYSDTTKNMYIWDLQWNEETKSYKADRVEELDNLLSFAGGSIWLGSNGVNGIRTYYATTADTEVAKGAFRNLGYEVVTHGTVVGWADKLNGSEPVPNGNNSAPGHSAGNGTFYDEIYPAADKYITPGLRARFYVELKNIETSESKIIYSGSVERSIGYIAYQNIGRVDAQYQPYVKAILDKAAAAGFTYGGK